MTAAPTTALTPSPRLEELPIDVVEPHPRNVRGLVGDVTELAESIAAKGILHPLLVVPHPDTSDRYRLIAGHRRHAAATQAGLLRVPCIIRSDLGDEADQLASMLSENVERSDLTILEEAAAVQGLLELGDTVAQAAARTGMSKRRIGDRSKVAKLPDDVRAKIGEHSLSLDDALFIAKHSTNRAQADILDRNLGTTNWGWAKQRVTEIERDRKAAEAVTAEIAAAGLDLVTGHPAAMTWRDEHGFTTHHGVTRVPWNSRDRDTDPSPARSVAVRYYPTAEPELWTFHDVAPVVGDPDAPPRAPAGPVVPGANPATPDEYAARRSELDQRRADLATAAQVRASTVSAAVGRGLDDAIVLRALRSAARSQLEEDRINEAVCDLVNIDTADIALAIEQSTSVTWLAMLVAFGEVGGFVHQHLSSPFPGYVPDDAGEWIELFEAMGHEWSDVEINRVTEIRDALAARAAQDADDASGDE